MTAREELRGYLKRHLFGPRDGVDEKIEGRVHLRYMLGVLFAQDQHVRDLGLLESETEGSGIAPAADGEDQAALDNSFFQDTYSRLPSSVGLSSYIPKDRTVLAAVSVGIYEKEEQKGENGSKTLWARREISDSVTIECGQSAKLEVLEGRATIRSLFRPLRKGGSVLTLSLVNEQTKSGGSADPTKDLFQVRLRCTLDKGSFPAYPRTESSFLAGEDLEQAFALRDVRPFAIGHGASVDWEQKGKVARSVELDYLPYQYVGRPVFDDVKVGSESFAKPDIFSIAYLANPATPIRELSEGLKTLVDFYEKWVRTLDAVGLPRDFKATAGSRIRGIEEAINRMRKAVAMLADPLVADAFRLANHAMLIQMVHGEIRRKGPFDLGTAKSTKDLDYLDSPDSRKIAWRPFQLAYLLLVMPSLVDEDDDFRDVVDVIWFSTGGGKTEAYLLVAAFILIYRRLRFGEDGCGTAVINRYTYRFLTADQFDRTAGLACALERVRRQEPRLLDQAFSVGLWVGSALTPNRFRQAEEKLEELMESIREGEAKNAFQIETCPDCGTRLFPGQGNPEAELADPRHYGFRAKPDGFETYCPNNKCLFHRGLPVAMVDESLYSEPPSFLIGTIDKFAMMPWRKEAGVFLGSDQQCRPPSLIIQDELHLISGPLGTLAGIYEAAVDTIISGLAKGGAKPKVIASSATIRNAAGQCQRLYGRKSTIFPSPGLDPTDSFFSRVDHSIERSRMYVGVMGQGVTNTVAVYWSIAALLQAVAECDMTEAERDAYWTLLAYHNSKRELGRTRNAVNDEIADRLKVCCEVEEDRRKLTEPLEISSNAVSSVATARAALNRRHTEAAPAFDIVPCTNMISVGIDIDRLGIMFVNGQPKLTSEYIQATSRVGRKDIPGFILTCLSPAKPRDLSHYETFKYFHSVMGSYVEPTSVTPGSAPALARALHAALVMVVRHSCGLGENVDANEFDPEEELTKSQIGRLRSRLGMAYDQADFEYRTIGQNLDAKVQEWAESVSPQRVLCFRANDRNSMGLLRTFSDSPQRGIWPTLQSMRHVDSEVELVPER